VLYEFELYFVFEESYFFVVELGLGVGELASWALALRVDRVVAAVEYGCRSVELHREGVLPRSRGVHLEVLAGDGERDSFGRVRRGLGLWGVLRSWR